MNIKKEIQVIGNVGMPLAWIRLLMLIKFESNILPTGENTAPDGEFGLANENKFRSIYY